MANSDINIWTLNLVSRSEDSGMAAWKDHSILSRENIKLEKNDLKKKSQPLQGGLWKSIKSKQQIKKHLFINSYWHTAPDSGSYSLVPWGSAHFLCPVLVKRWFFKGATGFENHQSTCLKSSLNLMSRPKTMFTLLVKVTVWGEMNRKTCTFVSSRLRRHR